MKTVLELLKGIRPEFDFTKSEDFIADGMLDSYDLMTLISELDQTYGISINGTDILPENVKNLAAITRLLQKYGIEQ
ncbi:MAG: acyl carrier protein [Deltaproteobacteria bacterium]|nr:acyl carrier protein [Deltaproteobacteria bacterium]